MTYKKLQDLIKTLQVSTDIIPIEFKDKRIDIKFRIKILRHHTEELLSYIRACDNMTEEELEQFKKTIKED